MDNLMFGRMLADVLTDEMNDYKVTYNLEKQNEVEQELCWENEKTGHKGTVSYHIRFLETYMYRKCTLDDILFTVSQMIEHDYEKVVSKEQEKIKKETAFKKEKDNIGILIMRHDECFDGKMDTVFHVFYPKDNLVAVAILSSENGNSYKIIDTEMPVKRWGVDKETVKRIAIENSKEHGVFMGQMNHKFNIVSLMLRLLNEV